MNGGVHEIPAWSRLRWAVAIGLAVLVQLGLVTAFTLHQPLAHPDKPVTRLLLPEQVGHELQALTDPTLLALGGPHGFSALWLEPYEPPPMAVRWTQDPRWLSLDATVLGADFLAFAESNQAPVHGLTYKVSPRVQDLSGAIDPTPLRVRSRLRTEGDVAGRPFLKEPELPVWPARDLLLPSEIRVVVDQRGIVLSAILIPPGSGSPQADRFALEQARQLRFEPIRRTSSDGSSLAIGRLVFEWKATPVPNEAAPSQ